MDIWQILCVIGIVVFLCCCLGDAERERNNLRRQNKELLQHLSVYEDVSKWTP